MSDNGMIVEDASKDRPPFTQQAILQKELNVEIVEAKTAVILLDSNNFFTKNEYIQWRLTHLFRPMVVGEKTQTMEVLYLSHQRKHNWLSEYKNDESNSIQLSAPATPLSPPFSLPSLSRHFVITPRTNVITFMQECRLVYIVDLSSSLATVGNTKSQILLFEVFRTLRNALEGVVHPFCLQTTPHERIMIKPTLRLTVLADCSQFASNVNVIPMLEDHPTMRVFVQNVTLSLRTIDDIVADLYEAFRVFQTDTTTHRKLMKQKRASFGYHLDVGEGTIPTYDRSLFDPTTSSSASSLQDQQPLSEYYRGSEEEEETKTVWGMGKTGANLSRMLHAGAFASSLFDPPKGRAQLILITDGALKAQIQDNTLWRQFAEQDLACHVIQIGFPQSFIPGRNFGFLPDVEILKFLAQATGGTFLYSNECIRLTAPEKEENEHRHDHRRHEFTTKRFMSPSEDEGEDSTGWWSLNPNIYHRHFVLRESNLEKIRTLTPFVPAYFPPSPHEGEDGGKNHKYKQIRHRRPPPSTTTATAAAVQASSNFPWDPEGITPPIEWRLLKYRDYVLPDDFAHMIAARAREGFYLQSVLFGRGELGDSPVTTPPLKKKDTARRHSNQQQRRQSSLDTVQLTFVFHWKPHVIIEYRIRAHWQPASLTTTMPSFYERARSPRVEIFIRSDAEFAHLIQHSHLLRRRFQVTRMMQAMQQQQGGTKPVNGGGVIGGVTLTEQAISKVEKLKTYLQYLFEGDEMLTMLIDPAHHYFSPWKNEAKQGSQEMDVDALKTRFCSFGATRFVSEDDRYQTRCWYDLECLDFLVGAETTRVVRLVSEWADITLIKNDNQQQEGEKDDQGDGVLPSFVKFLGRTVEKDVDYTQLQHYPSFCKIKIQYDYGCLITLGCLFFNATPLIRHHVKAQLRVLLESASAFVCERPFSSLLIRDQAHFVSTPMNSGSEKDMTKYNQHKQRRLHRLEQKRSWYMPVALWLTGEYIVHDYLWCARWVWQTGDDTVTQGPFVMAPSIDDLSYKFLCQARIQQGYQLVLAGPNTTHFYKEVSIGTSYHHLHRVNETSIGALQYFVQKKAGGRLQTELWVEPSVGRKYHHHCHYEECEECVNNSRMDELRVWTAEQDRKVLSHLVTFDKIQALTHHAAKASKLPFYLGVEDNLFDVLLVLKPNPFKRVSYTVPKSGNLYPYFERAARALMDVEINMAKSKSMGVWRALRKTAISQFQEQPVRLNKVLCFAKNIDSYRFFLILVLPYSNKHEDKCGLPMECLVFLCTRMTLDEALVLLDILKEDSEVVMTNDEEGSFLPSRRQQDPVGFLEQGDVLKKVDMIYGQAFLNSIYVAALTAKKVWKEDLLEALAVCGTTIIPIDLTTFVSTLQDTCEGDNDEMDRKWKLAWQPHFDPITVISSSGENKLETSPANVLVYTPDGAKADQHHPLFLSLNCPSIPMRDPTSFTELRSILLSKLSSKIATQGAPTMIQMTLVCQSQGGTLTAEQDQVLLETVARLDWMFTEQVLHQSLRSFSSPSVDFLRYVETQLEKQKDNCCYISIPFRFVMRGNGRQVLMDLLATTLPSIGYVDEYFYVTGTTAYWLLMVVYTNHVKMYYYSFDDHDNNHGEGEENAVEIMKERLKRIEKQANQTLLLSKLQETHSCSKYLEAPDPAMTSPSTSDSSPSSSQDSSASFDDVTATTLEKDHEPFSVGEFRCSEVYRRTFKVHWRVPPNKVLSYLKNDLLRPFVVTNRAQMYVIEREHTVVYCHFSHSPTTTTTGYYDLEMTVHGLICPLWIERDVVPMIENRLTDEVTLNELQTFFSRNPTTKPTLSDVHFILPFGDQPSQTETLFLPSNIDMAKLFRYFKKFLVNSLLRPFQGPQVVAALEDHFTYAATEQQENGGSLDKDDLCFYYNCTKRIPGVSTAIEVACGQGMAGLCMTLRDGETAAILTQFPSTATTMAGVPAFFDPEEIRHTMEMDPRRPYPVTRDDRQIILQVDLWTRGAAIDGSILLEHMHACYRRALCDTLIEQTVIHLHSSPSVFLLRRNHFVVTIVYLLQKSVDWQSPTINTLVEKPPGMDPWCMVDMMHALKDEVFRFDMDQSPPTILWQKLREDVNGDMGKEKEDWRVYRGRRQHVGGNHIRMVAISGLNEFVGGGGVAPSSHRPSLASSSLVSRKDRHRRQTSLKSGSSRKNSASTQGDPVVVPSTTASSIRSSSGPLPPPQSHTTSASSLSPTLSVCTKNGASSLSSSSLDSSSENHSVVNEEDEHEDASLHPLLETASGVTTSSSSSPQADSEKHCFMLMILDPDQLTLYTYNWSVSHCTPFFQKILTAAQYQRLRSRLLDNILHQKMGLFHHAPSIQTVTDEFISSCSADEPTADKETGLKVMVGVSRTMAIQNVLRNPIAPDFVHPATAGYSPITSAPTTPTSSTVKTPTSERKGGSSATKKPSISTNNGGKNRFQQQRRRKASTRKEENDLLAMTNPELNHVLLTAISDPILPIGARENILWRHGEPFLATYLQQATLRSAHRKARQVYTKWRNRFIAEEEEKEEAAATSEEGVLTRYEIAEILRSSRLLHFCRAPFFLFSSSLSEGNDDQRVPPPLLRSFVTQYARYLEKLNMQRVEFSDEDDQEEMASSFLLKIFDAGSILCEIRFIHAFVSVTLYGLHRDTAALTTGEITKKTRRRDFKTFEQNVAQLKHLIHINSFVYDFHLAYLQKQQGDEGVGLAAALGRFAAYYTTPTPYSTNRLFSGVYQVIAAKMDLEPFLDTLTKEYQRFGLHTTGDDGAIRMDTYEGDSWQYTLVLCPLLESQPQCLYLRYFVVVVHQVERTPGALVRNLWSTNGQASVLVKAREQIDTVVQKVMKTCHERADWQRLLTLPSLESGGSWRYLLLKFRHIPFLEGKESDPSVLRLVNSLMRYGCTLEAFDLFGRMYQDQCVVLEDSEQRHILLFPHVPPTSSADHLVHIKIDMQSDGDRSDRELAETGNGVGMWLVRRDSPAQDKATSLTTHEKRLVALLGQSLCYIQWKLLSDAA